MAFTKADKNRYMSLGQYWWQRLPQLVELINNGADFENASYGSPEWVLYNAGNFEDASKLAQKIVEQGYGGSRSDTINATAFFANQVNALPPVGSEIVGRNEATQAEPSSPEAPSMNLLANASVGDIVGAEEGLGRYGQGFVVTDEGLFHNISPEKLSELRDKGVVPLGTDPSLWNDVERIRARSLFDNSKPFSEYTDVETGNKFVFKDGGLFTSSAVPKAGTPTFVGNSTPGGAQVGSSQFENTSTVEAPPAQATVTPPATGGAANQGPFLRTQVTPEEPKVTKETLAIAGAVALVLVLAVLIFL